MGLKRALSIIIWATGLPLAAQSFSVGTSTDHCFGGTSMTAPAGTIRYGDFTCTLPVAADGLFAVRLDFLEPCADQGSCSGGRVAKAGQRVQNVYVQDALELSGFDSFVAGMGSVAPVSRTVLAYSAAGSVVVRVQTVVRSGVLSGVTISSVSLGGATSAQIARQQCVGSGTGWNCAGVELWTTKVGSEVRYWTVVPATITTWQLPACPSDDPIRPCLKTAAMDDPALSITGQAAASWPDDKASPLGSLTCGISVFCYKSVFVPATSIWSSDSAPVTPSSADQQGVTLGVKFRADVDGKITGIRYFQGVGNSGTHYGLLYAADRTVLAQATFTGETGSGWQQVSFPAVAITAGATYVAAYFTSTGYAHTEGYFVGTAGVDSVPLHALASGVDGPNGMFAYGAAPQFPDQSVGTNYWVDLVFAP